MKKRYICCVLFYILHFGLYAQPPAGAGLQTTSITDSSNHYVQLIVNSKIPVLVDFWAAWCGPCKMLTPILAEIEKEYRGKIKILKINVDHNRNLASYFKVASIPNVYIINDKVAVKNILGLQSKDVYIAALQEVLNMPKTSIDSL